MNPVAQGLPVHPGQPRRARTVHPFQRVGDREQTSGNPAIALLPRLPAQFLRTDVIPDHHGTHCGLPLSHHNICYPRPISDATLLASQPQLRWVLRIGTLSKMLQKGQSDSSTPSLLSMIKKGLKLASPATWTKL